MEQTNELIERLKKANDINSLEDYLGTLDGKYTGSLNEYLKLLMEKKQITASELIRKSKIERTYCYQILNGRKKPGRDKVIAIALALNLTLEETQRILEIAKEGVLYARSRRDSILIFSLNHRYSLIDTNQLLVQYGESELR